MKHKSIVTFVEIINAQENLVKRIRPYFDYDLHSEDTGEDVVKIVEDSVSWRLCLQGVLSGEHGTADENTGKDDVTEVGVVTDPPTEHAELVSGGEDEEGRDVRHGRFLVGDVELGHATRTRRRSGDCLVIFIYFFLIN